MYGNSTDIGPQRKDGQRNPQRINGEFSAPWHNTKQSQKFGGRGRRHKASTSSHHPGEEERPKSSHGRKPNFDDNTKFRFDMDPETSKPIAIQRRRKKGKGKPLNNSSVVQTPGNTDNHHQHQQQQHEQNRRRHNNHGLTAPAIKQQPGLLGTITGAQSGRSAHNIGDNLNRLKNNTGPVSAPKQQQRRRRNREEQNPSHQNNASIDLCDSDTDTDGETVDPVSRTPQMEQHQQLEPPVTTRTTMSPPQSKVAGFRDTVKNTLSDVIHRPKDVIDKIFFGRSNPEQDPDASGRKQQTQTLSGHTITEHNKEAIQQSLLDEHSGSNRATAAASRQQPNVPIDSHDTIAKQNVTTDETPNPSYIDGLNGRYTSPTSTQHQKASSSKKPSTFKVMSDNMRGSGGSSSFMNDNSFDDNTAPTCQDQQGESLGGNRMEYEAPLNLKHEAQKDTRMAQSKDENGFSYVAPPLIPGSGITSNARRLKVSKVNTVARKGCIDPSSAERKRGGTIEKRRAQTQAGINSEHAIACDLSDANDNDKRDRKELSSDDDGSTTRPSSDNAARKGQKNGGRKRTNEKSSSSHDVSIAGSQAIHRNCNSNPTSGDFFDDLKKKAQKKKYEVNKKVEYDPRKKSKHTNSFDFGSDDDEIIDDPPQNSRGPQIPTPSFAFPGESTGHNVEEHCSVSPTEKRNGAFSNVSGGDSLLGLNKLSQNASHNKTRKRNPPTKLNGTSNSKRLSRLSMFNEEQRNYGDYRTSTKSTTTKEEWKERQEKEERKKQQQSMKRKVKKTECSDSDYKEETEKRSRIENTRARRRSPRNRKMPSSGGPEMYDLCDSDSETDTPTKHDRIQEEEVELPPGVCYELSRIAFGSMVVKNGCQVIINKTDRMLTLVFRSSRISANNQKPARMVETIPLTESTFMGASFFGNKERKYSIISADAQGWVAMSIKKNYDSFIGRTHVYNPEANDSKKKYIILEFPDYDDSMSLVTDLGKINLTHKIQFLGDGEQIVNCAASLIHHKKKQAEEKDKEAEKASNGEEMKTRPKKRPRVNPHRGKKGDDLLLVYPFPGDKDTIEGAANGLLEASGTALAEDDETVDVDDGPLVESARADASAGETTAATTDVKVRHRKHFVTIREEDFDRLEPGEWLNDSLVDFWMQWISRDDTDLNSSNHHFFTSHFYTMLAENGPESVQSWTAKKNINIFEKRFIFVPINKDLHWSLCVVVNPGAIRFNGNDDGGPDPNDPLSCLIFMDSLRMHNKNQVYKHIRGWLNSEWKRLKVDGGESSGSDKPFTQKGLFPLFNPKVPYQNNTWDCGVFVCRYAYAIYRLRNKNFTRRDAGLGYDSNTPRRKKGAFYTLITTGNEFDFDMEDIERFRHELKQLIDNLSKIYLKMKDEKEKVEKEQKKNPEEEKENFNYATTVAAGKAIEEMNPNGSEDASKVEAVIETKNLDHTDGDDVDIVESNGVGTTLQLQNKNDAAPSENANPKEGNTMDSDDVDIMSNVVVTALPLQNNKVITRSDNDYHGEAINASAVQARGSNIPPSNERQSLPVSLSKTQTSTSCILKGEAVASSEDADEVSSDVGSDHSQQQLFTQPWADGFGGIKVEDGVETEGSSSVEDGSTEDCAKSETDQVVPENNNEQDGREVTNNDGESVVRNSSKLDLQERMSNGEIVVQNNNSKENLQEGANNDCESDPEYASKQDVLQQGANNGEADMAETVHI